MSAHISVRQFILIAVAFFAMTPVLIAQPDKVAKGFAEIAKRVEPSVVSIDTKGSTPQPQARGAQTPNDGSDIMEFLRRQMQQRPVRAVGSGFIVDKSGYIVTNAHVVDDAVRITVKLDSGEEFIARVVGTDELTDIAVLKIDAKRDLPAVKFGDSDKAEVGDWVLAIGSPFGLAKSVTAGIISQKERETPYASAFQRFIQTDAAINRGNSGGPLVNLDGEVVGVNSQIATSTGDYNGVGFALPSREADYVYGQIVKNGKVRRGYLGVLLDSVQPEFAAVYGLKEKRGSIITDVRDRQGPAAVAGLKVGDVIVEFNGQPVQNSQDLIAKVATTTPDQTVTVAFYREKGDAFEKQTATIKLAERPINSPPSTNSDRRPLPVDGRIEQKPFGLTLAEMTPTLAEQYKLEGQKGLVVKEINQASFIADIKNANGTDALGEGDLIQRINRVTVTDLKSFNDAVAKLKVGDPVVMHVLTYIPSVRAAQLKIVQFTIR
ncbi:MAG: trypsin-like peptidase domain-containing protein [Acidobacteria bacterium]|nr:trypsin-like peptidase domain-containing protein [Acidobacteriota bacterium]